MQKQLAPKNTENQLHGSHKKMRKLGKIQQTNIHMPVTPSEKKKRLKWLGHTLRMEEQRFSKIISSHMPPDKCTRGRQRKRWTDCVENDLKPAGLKLEGKTAGREKDT